MHHRRSTMAGTVHNGGSGAAGAPRPAVRRASLLPLLIVVGVVLAALSLYTWVEVRDGPDRFRLALAPHAPPAFDFRLTASDGRVHSLSDYRGRVVVLYFGFTRCPEACPLELYTLSQVMRQLGADRTRVQVLMVTLDPGRDTPALLRSYVTAFDPSFIGMTGTAGEINRAAAGYAVVSRRIPLAGGDYTLEHSAAVYIIDPRGRQRLIGDSQTSVGDLAHDLRQLID